MSKQKLFFEQTCGCHESLNNNGNNNNNNNNDNNVPQLYLILITVDIVRKYYW